MTDEHDPFDGILDQIEAVAAAGRADDRLELLVQVRQLLEEAADFQAIELLRATERHSQREIAEALEITKQAVQQQIARAKTRSTKRLMRSQFKKR